MKSCIRAVSVAVWLFSLIVCNFQWLCKCKLLLSVLTRFQCLVKVQCASRWLSSETQPHVRAVTQMSVCCVHRDGNFYLCVWCLLSHTWLTLCVLSGCANGDSGPVCWQGAALSLSSLQFHVTYEMLSVCISFYQTAVLTVYFTHDIPFYVFYKENIIWTY